MISRKRLLLGVSLVLLASNGAAWWWGNQRATLTANSTTQMYNYAAVPQLSPLENPWQYTPARRNLFAVALAQQDVPTIRKKPPSVAAPPVPPTIEAPLPASAEETARVATAHLKLVAIMFRGTQGQAFVADQSQRYLLNVGDSLYDRFIVEQITADSLTFRDRESNIRPALSLSGA